jgi:uncharacterized protein (PEP-CTERM system associated)
VERYEDTGVGLNLSHTFFTKFTTGLGGGYSRNDYNLPDDDRRHDDNYSFNIGLDYQIRDWLRTSIGYFLLVKNSNYDEFDFTDNRFMVELALLY